MKIKVNEWLKRYFPAEIISMILTIVSAELAFYFTQNNIAAALIATLIGNTVYFACILLTKVSEFVFSRIAVVHSWFPGFLALTS